MTEDMKLSMIILEAALQMMTNGLNTDDMEKSKQALSAMRQELDSVETFIRTR